MSAATYEDILNRAYEEVPTVKLLPDGKYRLRGMGMKLKPATDNANPSVNLSYTVIEPISVDDESKLDELGMDYDFSQNKIFNKLWFGNSTEVDRIKGVLEKHGVDLAADAKTFKGCEVVAEVSSRSYERGGEEVTENVITTYLNAE